MFWYLVQSSLLSPKHAFYEEVKAFCSRALSSLLSSPNVFFQEYPALVSWIQSNQFLHGKSATHFFYGVGGHRQGHVADASMFPAEWIKSHNFAGVSSRTITALNGTPNVSSEMQIDDLVHLYASLEDAKAVSLERQGVVGYLVITASDTMAIKPGKKPGFVSGIRRQDHAHSAITARRNATTTAVWLVH